MLNVLQVSVDGVRSAVHDNPGPMDDFESLIGPVSEFARVVAIDMPGFGRADRPREFDFTKEGYARHLGGVLAQLGVKRAHLVLHDWGGPWGLRWAADHPAALLSLTLINTGVMPGYRWHTFARIWQTPVLGELFQLAATDQAVRYFLNRDNPRPLPESFVERVVGNADWRQKRSVLKIYRTSRSGDDLAVVTPELAKVCAELPTCVVWGEADVYLPVKYAALQKESFPRAEMHLLPGLGHWPFVDDPDAVRARIVPFLRRQVHSHARDPSERVPSITDVK
jgi:pimeloyl-ACP methyl ester carboxylesterase